jgi:hypothetical protein
MLAKAHWTAVSVDLLQVWPSVSAIKDISVIEKHTLHRHNEVVDIETAIVID